MLIAGGVAARFEGRPVPLLASFVFWELKSLFSTEG
jgi:hypothetical protein